MEDVIDLKDVMERVQGDKELLCDLFDIFVEDFVGKRDQLNAAFERGDVKQFQMMSHALKGASGNISARQMHLNCIDLDAMGKKGDISGAKPMLSLLDRQFESLKNEMARLKKELVG